MAGTGLANGYLGNPELTEEKFRRHAVNGIPVRAYHSGDLGVVDDDGVLHYRGRQDRQIKISGNRVELTEIELVARDIAGVREAVVLPVTTSDGAVARLVLCYLAAITPNTDAAAGTARARDPLDVRKELQRRLPAYLVPSKVRAVERFPVTSNGKLDRAELLHIID
jgi:D-alanine--poly(phosphoribitol) ligase subunit 1